MSIRPVGCKCRHVACSFGKKNKLGRRVANPCSRTAGRPCLARCGRGDRPNHLERLWADRDLSSGLRYSITLSALALSQFGDMVITDKSELLVLTEGSSTLTR